MDVLDHRQHDVIKASGIKSDSEEKTKIHIRESLDHLNTNLDQLKQILLDYESKYQKDLDNVNDCRNRLVTYIES